MDQSSRDQCWPAHDREVARLRAKGFVPYRETELGTHLIRPKASNSAALHGVATVATGGLWLGAGRSRIAKGRMSRGRG